MAETFYRFPTLGGDLNAWDSYAKAQLRASVGLKSAYLYESGGALYISAGRIGINDGTNEGTTFIDAPKNITFVGTNGRWHKIEMEVSGPSAIFSNTALSGADPAILPTELTGSFSGAKQGFYNTATKRLIGVIWKDSSGALTGVINCANMIKGYSGYAYLNTAKTAIIKYEKEIDKTQISAEYQIGVWDMNATSGVAITHYLDGTKIKNITAMVLSDAGAPYFIPSFEDVSGTPQAGVYMYGGGSLRPMTTFLYITRTNAGRFDTTDFDDGAMNRGFIYVEVKE